MYCGLLAKHYLTIIVSLFGQRTDVRYGAANSSIEPMALV